MSSGEELERLSRELDEQTDKLEQESERLGKHIRDARDDWEAKRRDDNVPGAVPPPENDQSEPRDEDTDSKDEDTGS